MKTLAALCFLLPAVFSALPSFPLPLDGQIQNAERKVLAKLKIYHEYVEVYSNDGRFLARVGILAEKGQVNIYFNTAEKPGVLIAYANNGLVYSPEDRWIASYSATPVYTYVFDRNGDKLGRAKCIAWQRVCGLAAAAYLLQTLPTENKRE